MKKALAFLLIFLITICLTACGDAREPLYSQTDRTAAGAAGIGTADGEELNELLPIYNAQNEKIGEINLFGTVMPTNGGFVYTVHSGSAMEYYQYTVSNQESVKLGSVENWAIRAERSCFPSQSFVHLCNDRGRGNTDFEAVGSGFGKSYSF